MSASERIVAFLKLLGYTPKTLAADIGVSVWIARRILCGEKVTFGEYTAICQVTQISPSLFVGQYKPGAMRLNEKEVAS